MAGPAQHVVQPAPPPRSQHSHSLADTQTIQPHTNQPTQSHQVNISANGNIMDLSCSERVGSNWVSQQGVVEHSGAGGPLPAWYGTLLSCWALPSQTSWTVS